MSKVIKQQGFKQKSSVKHVKTRTPYKAVDQYEKRFKYAFAKDLGNAMDDYIKTMADMLNVGNIKLTKAETGVIDVLNTDTDCGVNGDCGHTLFEI